MFSEAVMVALFFNNFRGPNITLYDSRGDPVTHVEVFHSWIDFERFSELARSRVFLLTLLRLA